MAETDDIEEKPNGAMGRSQPDQVTLPAVLRRLAAEVFFPDPSSKYGSGTAFHRIRGSISDNVPLLNEASRRAGHDILLWTRRGSPLRALLVVSVGTIFLLALTGTVVFMLFLLAATFNAIVVSLLMSLAAAGGFLALFFACLTAIYIGALSVAVLVISMATISAIITVLIVTGWIGFFWIVWSVARKGMGLAKDTFTATGSALSASSARFAPSHHEADNSKIK
ncbi:hypothetical protein NMG60_11007609 [Bertholletia excelsa]